MTGNNYTRDEVRAMFPGMTKFWLEQAIRTGLVPHIRLGYRVILFTDEHVDEIRRRFEVKPTPRHAARGRPPRRIA